MIDLSDGWADSDLVLSVAPPVPRRTIATPMPPPAPSRDAPAATHTSMPAVLTIPPVPPAPAQPPAPPVVVEADDVPARAWPDRRWWASTGASFVVHVVLLVALALVVAKPEATSRPRPLEIAQRAEDQEPMPFVDPDEELAVEMLPLVADVPLPEPVEQAVAVVDDSAIDTVATAFAADDAADGLIDLEPDGMLARIGAGGAGQGVTGFGGAVGRRLARAGAKSGDIQVSLSWNNFNDLDLHVIAPSGERIYFAHRRSGCRGELDVDMNAAGPVTREPVENVYWPARAAPKGEYQVFVHHYAQYDRADATAFDVHVLVNGSKRHYSGSVRFGDPPAAVTRFVKGDARTGEDEFVE